MKIEDAIMIAIKAHQGQVDKCGVRYILHPLHVMKDMDTEDGMVCAILHDVVEDTSWTLDELKNKGLTEIQSKALDLLTHKKDIPDLEYIKHLSSNYIANRVKAADLRHNLDIGRMNAALENGADVNKMRRKRRLYIYAYYGLMYGYCRKDWFPKAEELFSEPGYCYLGHHMPTGEEWYLLGIDLTHNLVCAAGYPPSQARLSDFSLIIKEKPITQEELSYRNSEFQSGRWN